MRATPGALDTLENAVRDDYFNLVFDFDGTLSRHVADPTRARPVPGAVASLQEMAATDRTDSIALTGRAKREIVEFFADDPDGAGTFAPDSLRFTRPDGRQGTIYVLGHHGTEVDPEYGEPFVPPLSEEDSARRQRLEGDLRAALAARFPDLPITTDLSPDDVDTIYLERKDRSVGVHTRSFDHDDASRARAAEVLAFVREFHAANADGDGGPLYVTPGAFVEEVAVTPSSKGLGIGYVRSTHDGPVVFLGDDFTDVAGFEALREGDVGVVVGDRIIDTLRERGLLDRGNLLFVDTPEEAAELLGHLATGRAAHVRGEAWDLSAVRAMVRGPDQTHVVGPRLSPAGVTNSTGVEGPGGTRRPAERRSAGQPGEESRWPPRTRSSSSPTACPRTSHPARPSPKR